jgi:hypothetical protein
MAAATGKIPLDPVSAFIVCAGALLGRTWRCSFSAPSGIDPWRDGGQGRIYCFWHSHLLQLAYIFRSSGKTAVVSESRDGMRAAAVAQRWHHRIISGSSSRGGAGAVRACVRALKNGACIVITPDGPRGPREIVKGGIARIALLAGARVVPVAAHPDRAWRLDSWDRLVIPKPFARISVVFGDPIDPAGAARENDPAGALTKIIQAALRP